jgi:serine/threonine protein kinase
LHDDRYRIVHKLGHGSFSTAWLALDQESSEYVAVKVGTADANKHEADILSRLVTASVDESLIPAVIDQFSIDGPNGTHPCLVTTPARCSLAVAKEESESRLFQLDVARSLAVQLVSAVAHVHSHGYAHGGKFACKRGLLLLSIGKLIIIARYTLG